MAGVMLYGPQRLQGLWRYPLVGTDTDSLPVSTYGAGHTLPVMVGFMAALFGHELTEEDRAELLDRLAYTVKQVPQRAAEYAALELVLDRLARNEGAASFADAS